MENVEKIFLDHLSSIQKIESDTLNVPAVEIIPLLKKNYLPMIFIPNGEFIMGNNDGNDDEFPAHPVHIMRSFYMSAWPITQEQWEIIMGQNPSRFVGEKHPVENISWEEANLFIDKLNKMLTVDGFRLPTEAEWEYSCRAGSKASYCFGNDINLLKDYAWYYDNSNGHPQTVGQLKPNAWGVHDMHGNVWEWCDDWYGEYPSDLMIDPNGPLTGTNKVSRGGSWLNYARSCQAGYRSYYSPQNRGNGIGFRIVRSFE
ncbi:MAG: formylglycine-generating enzyme family protein [Desulfobacterales bacterium]|nr:formylglycine-generating enzyme family protein [Desulfobacterales bacterium]